MAAVRRPVAAAACSNACAAVPKANKPKLALVKLAFANVATAVMLTAAPALASPDLVLGQQVFEGNCAACHGGGGNTVKPGYTLKKDDIEKYLDNAGGKGLNITAIVYQIQNGKGGMPAWEGVLEDEEIEAVAAYVYDQAFNNKW